MNSTASLKSLHNSQVFATLAQAEYVLGENGFKALKKAPGTFIAQQGNWTFTAWIFARITGGFGIKVY